MRLKRPSHRPSSTADRTRRPDYKGMRWYKCDLHVHTPEHSQEWRDDDTQLGEPRSCTRTRQAARTYLHRCHDRELQAIGVTDHNYSNRDDPDDRFIKYLVEQNRRVARDRDREPLWIFPGFEIDIGYHLVCLFPPTRTNTNSILKTPDDALNTLGLTPGRRFHDKKPALLRRENQTVALRTVLKVVQEDHKGLVIAAHAFSTKGICRSSPHIKDYQMPELHGIEVGGWPLEGRARSIIDGRSREWKRRRPPGLLMSSDAKSLGSGSAEPAGSNEIGCRFTWIKMSLPSIESLRQALLDPKSRIRLPEDPAGSENPDSGQTHARVQSARSENTRFLADLEMAFSPNLNCVVGGRGTGKSTLFEYLRLCLRKDQTTQARAKDQIERIRGTISPESEIGLEWRGGDGSREAVAYDHTTRKAHIEGRTVDRPEVVFGRMRARVFSQGQLSEVTTLDENRQPVFLLPLIDQLCGNRLESMNRRASELREEIDVIQARRRATDQQRQRLATLRAEVKELDREWRKRAAVREEAEQHRRALEARRYLERLERDSGSLAQELGERAESIPDEHAPIGSALEHWPESEWFRALDVGVEAAREKLSDAIRKAVAVFQHDVESVSRRDPRWPAVQETLNGIERAFREACERQGLGPDDIHKLADIEQERRGKSLEIERLEKHIEGQQRALDSLAERLSKLEETWWKQQEIRRELATRLQESPSIPKVPASETGEKTSFVELRFSYMGEWKHFEELWYSIAPDGRTRLGRAWEDIGNALLESHLDSCREFTSSLDKTGDEQQGHVLPPLVRGGPWARLRSWIDGSSACPDLVGDLVEDLRDHLQEHQEQWERLQLARVRDSVDLVMYRPDGTRVGSLQTGRLSDGQRNTAVLALLLADGDEPVLIDQPEDELDASFIYDQLVPMLRGMKDHRQLIIVTHNPNIPVNADAELVVALETRDGRGEIREAGGLDCREVTEAVLDIMEGSRAAFQKRREKYGF